MIQFLGLEDVDDVGGSLNTERFSFVNPILSDRCFFEVGGEFPWANDEPRDLTDFRQCVV